MYVLVTYVPESHLESLKAALFSAGAGRIGAYDSCSWQCLGQGQFRPLSGAHPFLGKEGELERVSEWRLECVLEESAAAKVLAALKASHPYETPAYHFLRAVEDAEL
jgi:hypothetical protein